MGEPLFSIVIPHKDIPDLLMRCLKSIPVSEDIQVVVVDDNSPDADTYLQRYPELSRPYLEFVRTTKGGGAGYARNVGLDHAKGKWLLLADSDDLFVDDMLDIILPHVDSKADMIFFKKKSVLSDDINKTIERVEYINEYVDDYLTTGCGTSLRLCIGHPWGKISISPGCDTFSCQRTKFEIQDIVIPIFYMAMDEKTPLSLVDEIP